MEILQNFSSSRVIKRTKSQIQHFDKYDLIKYGYPVDFESTFLLKKNVRIIVKQISSINLSMRIFMKELFANVVVGLLESSLNLLFVMITKYLQNMDLEFLCIFSFSSTSS